MTGFDKLKTNLMKNEEFARIYNERKPLRNFIDELIELRVEKGMTQKDLSELTGISVPNISRIEAGKQNLSYQMMHKLVNALGGKILITAQADNCISLSNVAAEKLRELSDEANTSPEEFLINLLQKASEESITA
ncbi:MULTISPECIES: helix-turn-helix domain-containing protein [unclassified Mesotoga]|uniref:helix-turn-helix domain-containing protein n=1 Tax=unclassified Mesotoga TaxID=1184398 RepID=UPI000C9AF2DE|nr:MULTISPECIES: helix-turn-helix transcriptional regulator [unclassified Mesotoga]RAO95569.1 XRE family transcriptional regulator [Mesotoga sp. Brook.08.YT.4.2.5.4.]